MIFNTDVAVTFVGLIAALFVATLVVKSFESRKRTGTGTLIVHFSNFVISSGLLLAMIAGDTSIDGGGGTAFWLLGIASTGGFLVMLWLDLIDRRNAVTPPASRGWRPPQR